jgi:hypothetical protein
MICTARQFLLALALVLSSPASADSAFREACAGTDAGAVEKMLQEGQDPNEVYTIRCSAASRAFSSLV